MVDIQQLAAAKIDKVHVNTLDALAPMFGGFLTYTFNVCCKWHNNPRIRNCSDKALSVQGLDEEDRSPQACHLRRALLIKEDLTC